MEGLYPLEKQLSQLSSVTRSHSNSSKKQKINEIRYFKTNGPRDAKPRQGHRLHQITALAGIKRQLRTVRSDAFSLSWCAHQRRRISVSELHLEEKTGLQGLQRVLLSY